MDCPLQNSVTPRLALLSCPGCDPFFSLWRLPSCLEAFLCSSACSLAAFHSVTVSAIFQFGPGIRIFHLRKPTWQKASSGFAKCLCYDPYLIHSFHSWRKLNEAHNLRYGLRWGRNPLNHEFHYLENLIQLKIAAAHSCYNHFLVFASVNRHLNLKLAWMDRDATVAS